MFDPFLRAVAQALAALYELPVIGGSYGEAIILLTLIVMILLMPLTLKATRSTIKMTQMQPELKRLQKKYKDDRETLNQEMMKLYQEHGINPVGGCLPMLAQLPVFLVLFQVLRGLTRRISDQPFYEAANLVRERNGLEVAAGNEISPRYISQDSEMYQNLAGSTEMGFGPFDLAAEAWDVLGESIFSGIPYVLLILVVVGTSYYQQRQISARRGADVQINPQQQLLLRFLPLLSGVWSFIFPAGLVLYWATSNTFRIGQQAYITRQIYGKEAEEGKNDLKIKRRDDDDDDDEPVKKKPKNDGGSGGASKNNGNKNAKNKNSQKNAADDNGSGKGSGDGDDSSKGDRKAEWEKLRAKKKAAQRSSTTTSSRVTPKGTQSRPAKPKRKR